MLKKNIQFEDLDGNVVSEDFYFNLSEAELAEMELMEDGGMVALLTQIVKEGDNKKILEHFKRIIMKAYGVRGDDGRRFIKSDELSKAFMETDAYTVLFMELMTNATFAGEFISGVIPRKIRDRMPSTDLSELDLPEPKIEVVNEMSQIVPADLAGMTREQLLAALANTNK